MQIKLSSLCHSLMGPGCVFCCVTAQHEMCEERREHSLPSSCVSWGNMLPRSMAKIKECRECVFSICRALPRPTSVSHSPQGFNYCLPSPLISTSRPLVLNARARRRTPQIHSGAHVWTQTEQSQVRHTHPANTHMFHGELPRRCFPCDLRERCSG